MTDGQTDGLTDGFTIANTALSAMLTRCKNEVWWAVHIRFVSNALGHVSTKNWQNSMISDYAITNIKRVTFF